MEKPVKGDIVLVPFPYSDLSAAKKRPALVAVPLKWNDVVLCQITSKARLDCYSVTLSNADFSSGGLPVEGVIRPNRLFTADARIILRKAGNISKSKIKAVEETLIHMFSA